MLGALVLLLASQPTAAPTPERAIAEPVAPDAVLDRVAPADPVPFTAAEPKSPFPADAPPAKDPFDAPPPVADPAPQPQDKDPFGAPAPGLPADAAGLQNYVKVQKPRGDGAWMFAVAGVAFGGGVITQVVDAASFRNSGSGVLERAFFATTIVLSATGANARARHHAYYDTALRMPTRKTKVALGLGAALTALGAAAGVANEVMWWKCAIGDEGPYHTGGVSEFEEFSNRRRRPCNYSVGRGVLDASVISASAGLGMLVWSLRYRHDTKAFANARLVVAPSLSPNFRGLAFSGRF